MSTNALPHTRTQSGSEDRILRYTLAERVVHWVAGLSYIYLLITGLAFWSPYLFWLADLVGGGPTFVGAIVGTVFVSQYVSVLFLTLAAGAIVYVVAELLNVGRRLGAWDVTVWGVLAGFLAGVATELVIAAAGA